MIWLRERIERGRKHRWLGPLFIILLLLLLVFVAAHATMDQAAAGDADYVCIVVGFLVLLSVFVPRPRETPRWRSPSSRAPPGYRSTPVTSSRVAAVFSPLRI